MRFGVHVSISGKLTDVVSRATERGCETVQIFTRNPRGWYPPKQYTNHEIDQFIKALADADIYPLIVHEVYLVNIATSDDGLHMRSAEVLASDLAIAQRLGALYVVVHAGSHGDVGKSAGLERAAACINMALRLVKNEVMVLVENEAGAGTEIGSTFDELKEIIDRVENSERVGVCLDLCHAYVAGYDITHKEGVDNVVDEFDRKISLQKLKLLHANDTTAACGSKIDRHEHIGKGNIGLEGFRCIVNHDKLKNLPVILETPIKTTEADRYNLSVIRSLVAH